jgi:hypothetical protein
LPRQLLAGAGGIEPPNGGIKIRRLYLSAFKLVAGAGFEPVTSWL